MYKDKKILCIIPARGETKKNYKKNTKYFNGYPLFTWVLKTAIKSSIIDKIIVSTEDEEIIKISQQYGDFVPFKRSLSLSKDESSISDVIKFNIEQLKKEELEYDYILILLPTQPLIETFHLEEAIKLIIDNDYPSLIAMTKVEDNFSRIYKNNTLQKSNDPIYKINNSLFINKATDNDFQIYNNIYPYIIDSKYDGNIDSKIDWELSELKQLLIQYNSIS